MSKTNYNNLTSQDESQWVVVGDSSRFIIFEKKRGKALSSLKLFTNETAHPFYPIYYKEVERRIEISLRAYYARTWDGLANLVKNENVRYLAFFRSDYPRSGVKEGRFFKPFKAMVKQLTSYEPEQYIGWRLFYNEKESQSPFIVYKDSEVVVIDLAKLRESGSTEQKI